MKKNRIKVGSLCAFVSRKKHEWMGVPTIGNENTKIDLTQNLTNWFNRAPKIILFSKPHVTILEKKSKKVYNLWVSYSLVLGNDKTGQQVKAWVQTRSLRLVSQ